MKLIRSILVALGLVGVVGSAGGCKPKTDPHKDHNHSNGHDHDHSKDKKSS